MKTHLVLLGPPGAGKGTQARQLKRRLRIPHVSTGAILRDAVQAGTPLGLQVQEIMARGALIDDALMTSVVNDRLRQPDIAAGFLLDGYPRTIAQARALDEFMVGLDPLLIVEIVLSDAEVLRRLASRLVCAECGTNAHEGQEDWSCHDCGGPLVPRADDREEVVRSRLEVYRHETKPLVHYYGERPSYVQINGAQLADDVTADIVSAVKVQTGL